MKLLSQLRCGGAALTVVVAFWPIMLVGQSPSELPAHVLQLDRMDAFENPGANWSIVGAVASNPDLRHDLATEPGTGVLVNLPTEEARDNLFSNWTHGDIDLDLEVLMPRESNSGIYLQGRYEVQLLDSYGRGIPRFGDIGGIYERWNESAAAGQNGFEGRPPRLNVARAPGLWQQMHIAFRAPRFDAEGRKIANARFVRVSLNGVVIQENVEVTGPTRGAISEDEVPEGPLIIQGDHGPVAFRNVSFKRYDRSAPALEDVRYRAYVGEIQSYEDISRAELVVESTADALSLDGAPAPDNFGLIFDASFAAPISGDYHFSLRCGGGCRLEVGGAVLGPNQAPGGWTRGDRTLHLPEGRHPVRVAYFKSNRWRRPALSVYVEGPGFERTPLHANEPLRRGRTIDPIYVDVGSRPEVIRSFMEHDGVKRTHVVSVGSPQGVHYSYDLETGTLLKVWRGDFLEVTDMWHERGEPQIAVPRGALLGFPMRPSLLGGSGDRPMPDTINDLKLRYKGYEVAPDGYPSYQYELDDLRVVDHLSVSPQGGEITRTLSASGRQKEPLWVRIASAKDVVPAGESRFVLDGRRYYLHIEDASDAVRVVSGEDGMHDVVAPLSPEGGVVRYAISF